MELREVSLIVLIIYCISLQFHDGIMFPDTVEVNFSLTVDPYNRRKSEFNDNLLSTVISRYLHYLEYL